MKIALVTAIAAFALDEDLAPLQQALHAAGVDAPIGGLGRHDGELAAASTPRCCARTWDYTERLPEFLDWARAVQAQTLLLEPVWK
jgi:O-ureido-D-serine cyclo-ligase